MDTLISVLYHGDNSIDRLKAGLVSNLRMVAFQVFKHIAP
jgi:hypothetical protein